MRTAKTTVSIILLLFVLLSAVLWAADGIALSELDKEKLMRTDAQLQLIQQQFQRQAQPILDEQTGIVKRICEQIKATPGVDCDVNVQSGKVTKKEPAKESVKEPVKEPVLAPAKEKK